MIIAENLKLFLKNQDLLFGLNTDIQFGMFKTQ